MRTSPPSSEPSPSPSGEGDAIEALEMGEPVGGLLAMDDGEDLFGDELFGEELALGDPDDYGDFSIALGEDDAGGASVALTFGVSDTLAGDGEWDLGDVQELVVQETKGDFGGDGSSARDDAMVMEAEYDPDAEIVEAVWADAQGAVHIRRTVRRSTSVDPVLLPYGVIAGLLLILGGAAAVVVVGLVLVALLTPSPEPVPTGPTIPDVQIDEKAIEEAKKKTPEQILEEVLGEAGDGKTGGDDAPE